jgi:arylsulfatase A-like enzyme
LEESALSFAWHKDLARFAIQKMSLNAVIQNIYSPNQMLTSRWWTGFVDPHSRRYQEKTPAERARLMNEVKNMYRQVDAILGQILDGADPDTIVVFSSDHGAIPLDREVRLNNLFAKNGLLKFGFNKTTRTYEVDWARTQAVFLKMDGIYLNPKGLDGNYQRAQGPEYEKLRDQVRALLTQLADTDGTRPLEKIVNWEDAGQLGLPPDRVGDLVIANRAGYNWTESMDDDLTIFAQSAVTGYKQTVLSEDNPGMWTPFVIVGPGIKKGHALSKPIHHMEQYPTIMRLLNEPIPDFVEGKPVQEAFVQP